MTKQTAQEWLRQEVEKLGFYLGYISNGYWFALESSIDNSEVAHIYYNSQQIDFKNIDIDCDNLTLTFEEIKKLIEIAEQYKEMS